MTADEALKEMREWWCGPRVHVPGRAMAEWADAIEAELRRLREENERLRELADEKPSGMSWKEATS